MSRSFSIKSGAGGAALTTTFKSVLAAIASGNARVLVYEFMLGTVGPPADQAIEFSVDNASAMVAGTNNTTVTPTPIDPGTPATTHTTAGGAWTAEPTVGSNFLDVACNMRQMVRWVAKDGKELIAPATATDGVDLRVLSPTYTGDVRATIFYSEG